MRTRTARQSGKRRLHHVARGYRFNNDSVECRAHFLYGLLGPIGGTRLSREREWLSLLKQRSVHKACRVASASFGLLLKRRFFGMGDFIERRKTMFPFGKVKVRSFEKGLLFRDGEFVRLLDRGKHWFFDPAGKIYVDVVSMRAPWLERADLDIIVKSGTLEGRATVIDLKDGERALVWIRGRFDAVLGPGQYALWTECADVKVETVDTKGIRFEHEKLNDVLKDSESRQFVESIVIPTGSKGLFYRDGDFVETLAPGQYTFWRDAGKYNVYLIDCRESVADVAGQEIMTSDKVTLRINAIVTYRVSDEKIAVSEVEDFRQSLYREAQLTLRAVIGTRDLDTLLGNKDEVIAELHESLQKRVSQFGLKVVGFGIKDIILPGEMKELLNQVTQAKKAAEASVITRREETAAMRSQANTAKILESNPVLMRLKELETLEKVAETTNLNVVLGEKGLADRLVNLV